MISIFKINTLITKLHVLLISFQLSKTTYIKERGNWALSWEQGTLILDTSPRLIQSRCEKADFSGNQSLSLYLCLSVWFSFFLIFSYPKFVVTTYLWSLLCLTFFFSYHFYSLYMLFVSLFVSSFSCSLPVNILSHKTGTSSIGEVRIWGFYILEKCLTQFPYIKDWLLTICILGLQSIYNESTWSER